MSDPTKRSDQSPPEPDGLPAPETEPVDDSLSAWRAIGAMEERLRVLEAEREKTRQPESWTLARVLGKQLSVSSIIALLSGALAVGLSVRTYRQSLPSHNIHSLGVQVDPYPMYFWYSRYLVNLSVDGGTDFDPRIKDEKAARFASIETGSLSARYFPFVRIVNEGSRLYSITAAELELGPAWELETSASYSHMFGAFTDEEKYETATAVSTGGEGWTTSAKLDPGDVLNIFPAGILRWREDSDANDAWIQITLRSGDADLITIRQRDIVLPADQVGFLLGLDLLGNDEALVTAFESAGFPKLAAAVSAGLAGRGGGQP